MPLPVATLPVANLNDMTSQMMKAQEELQALLASYMHASTKSGAATWRGVEETTRNLNGMMHESYARMVSAYKTILGAKSPQEAAETHTEFMKDCFDGIVAGSGKLSEITLHTAKGAIEPMTQHATAAVETIMKKAKVG